MAVRLVGGVEARQTQFGNLDGRNQSRTLGSSEADTLAKRDQAARTSLTRLGVMTLVSVRLMA